MPLGRQAAHGQRLAVGDDGRACARPTPSSPPGLACPYADPLAAQQLADGRVGDQPARARSRSGGPRCPPARSSGGWRRAPRAPRRPASAGAPRIQRMPSGSSPLTGSSNSSTGGSPSSAAASPSRWRMPSEKPPTRRLRDARQADQLEHLVHPLRGQRRCCGPATAGGRAARRPGWTAPASSSAPTWRSGCAASGMAGRRPARSPGVGRVEPEDHPHRRRLAGPVGADEPGHAPGPTLNDSPSTASVTPNRLLSPRTSMVAPDRTLAARRRGVVTRAERSSATSPARGTRRARPPERMSGVQRSPVTATMAACCSGVALGVIGLLEACLGTAGALRRPPSTILLDARGDAAADHAPHRASGRAAVTTCHALVLSSGETTAGAGGGDRRPGLGALPSSPALPRLGGADARAVAGAAGARRGEPTPAT